MNGALHANPRAESLLAHLGWVQALARRLVGDPELAEDLAQEACVVALERRPRDERQLRRWLASVLRNLARQRFRSEGRRRLREERGARREGTPSTAELVEEASAQREVVASVLELDEPYRSTVLLRYFQGLPPREIARRQGIPVGTVQCRLKRAHARLRERLDERYGGRSAWSVFLAPAALAPRGAAAGSLLGSLGSLGTWGTLVMKLQIGLAAAVVALGAALYWIGSRPAAPEGVASPAVGALASAPPVEPLLGTAAAERGGGELSPAGPSGERDALVPEAPASPAAQPAAARPPFAVRGRVLDGRGDPRAGVPLVAGPGGRPLATSEPGGGFRFETAQPEGLLVAAADGLVTVRDGAWRRGSGLDAVVVVAPAVALEGRVVREDGRAVAGAAIGLRLPEDFRARFPTVLEGSRERGWATLSGEDGRFALDGAPGLEGATLVATREGYRVATAPAPAEGGRGLVLVLERPRASAEGTLLGRVVDAAGRGVAGARVGLGLASVRSEEDGGFAIDLGRAVTAERLCAVKEGFAPGCVERPGEPLAGAGGPAASGWPDFVVVYLGPPARALAGKVVDHQGRPRAGVKVWLDDPTPFQPVGLMPTTAEALSAGAAIPAAALQSEASLPEEDGDSLWENTAPVGPSTAVWHWVASDAEGRFVLPGLGPRAYRLAALDPDSMQITRSEPLEASGGEVVLRLDPPRARGPVAGRVVSAGDRPVEGALVRMRLPVVARSARVRGGESHVFLSLPGPRVRTDADGAFAFADAPRAGLSLDVEGEDVVEASFALDDQPSPRSLELEVEVRCHFQVELEGQRARADAFRVEGPDGERLDLFVVSHQSVSAYTTIPLVEGASGIVSASSRARRLVLLREGEEVESHPIALVPGEVTRLSW